MKIKTENECVEAILKNYEENKEAYSSASITTLIKSIVKIVHAIKSDEIETIYAERLHPSPKHFYSNESDVIDFTSLSAVSKEDTPMQDLGNGTITAKGFVTHLFFKNSPNTLTMTSMSEGDRCKKEFEEYLMCRSDK